MVSRMASARPLLWGWVTPHFSIFATPRIHPYLFVATGVNPHSLCNKMLKKAELFAYPLFLESALPQSWAAVAELPLATWREKRDGGDLTQRRKDAKEA